MYCKKITYTDFDGKERTEEFYFNLTEAEIIEWMTTNSTYTIDKVLENMSKKMDVKGIIEATKELIYRAYGEKSIDGRRFCKTPDVKANFMETNAYSTLFMELATNAEEAANFFNSIIPSDLATKVDTLIKNNPDASTEELKALAAGTNSSSSNVVPLK